MLAALSVGGVFILAVGEKPFVVYRILFLNAFGSADDIGYVLFNATPLVFTGLAVAIGFRAGLFNIGCEGQLYVAAFVAAWVGFRLNVGFFVMPACIFFALLASAAWGAIPGLLKAKLGAHEVINSIMLNFIAIALTNYLVTTVCKEAGQMTPQTPPIAIPAQLPRLAHILPILPRSNPLTVTFLIAILIAYCSYFFLWKTKWGYELRMVGHNPSAAEYGGINVSNNTVLAMTLGGMVAGLAGVWDVLGYRHRFLDNFSPGLGYTGIAVALLGRNHPLGVVVAALFFGLLQKGALDINIFTNVPREIVLIIQASTIIFLIASERVGGWVKKQRKRENGKTRKRDTPA